MGGLRKGLILMVLFRSPSKFLFFLRRFLVLDLLLRADACRVLALLAGMGIVAEVCLYFLSWRKPHWMTGNLQAWEPILRKDNNDRLRAREDLVAITHEPNLEREKSR